MSLDQVREGFTLHDVKALSDYWATTPPVHISVAAFVGAKSAKRPAEPSQGPGQGQGSQGGVDMAEVAAVAGPSRGKFVPRIPIHGKPPA